MNASPCSSGHRRGRQRLCLLNQSLTSRRTSQAGDNTPSSSLSPLCITAGCRESTSREAAPQQAHLSLTRSLTALSLQLAPQPSFSHSFHQKTIITETMKRKTASQEDLLKVGRKPKTVTWITAIYICLTCSRIRLIPLFSKWKTTV